jgi:hypothetical protein
VLGTEVDLALNDLFKRSGKEAVFKANAVQKCNCVRGFERIVVQKYCENVRDPSTARDIHSKDYKHATDCVPWFLHEGECSLLWGTGPVREEDDDEAYTAAPQVAVASLIKQRFQRDLQKCTPEEEFEWWEGGAMQTFATKPVSRTLSATRARFADNASNESCTVSSQGTRPSTSSTSYMMREDRLFSTTMTMTKRSRRATAWLAGCSSKLLSLARASLVIGGRCARK